ncbi:TonB-dependent receptor [Proteiniphilum sp. X52]|uniref:SusC/RagA family TonB-linked outer membrane protein n=1 Tax=Proteiniphilum sp. X52 TaxID=2382159 RepID=UPI000F09D6FD|nr:TonB-dependent receptor [Proteiniphilum sp. X52]RNC66406.1 TonB-dependent receptor [Proteiniphilum sp. X52]
MIFLNSKIFRFIFISFFSIFFISVNAFAQRTNEITVNGVVYDEEEMPAIGAAIQVKGESKGVVTDMDGNFSISTKANSTLVISYLGYQAQEINVSGRSNLTIRLVPDDLLLDEVVVVGYGSMRRSDLTGSVSSVGSKAIEGFKTSSVVGALGGQIAGVQVTQSDGTPGSGFDIKIRGVGTLNGDASPLFIVDGFEVGNIDYLSNSDIESIDILKDASASAIYGARAANGVVLVTTKSGKEGKPKISYNGSSSYREITKKFDLLSPYEFVKLQLELNPGKYGNTYFQEGVDSEGNPYKYQNLDDYIHEGGVDWQSEAFKPTWSQNHDISLTGGTKESQYAASFSAFNEKGIFKNSGFKKYTGRLRFNQKITQAVTLNTTVNYANTTQEGIGTSGTGGTLTVLSNLLNARNTGGLRVSNEELLNSVFDPLELSENPTFSQINPIKQTEAVTNKRNLEMWGINAALNIQLTKGLTFRSSATYNATHSRRDIFYGENSSQAYRSGGVYGSTQMNKDVRWGNSNTLTYRNKVNKAISYDLLLGQEATYRSGEHLYGQTKDFPFDHLGNDNLGLGATPSRVETSKNDKLLLSYFTRANFNYTDRYLLTATLRADGSTVFSDRNKWGYFPSFAGAWRVSEEEFMPHIPFLSNFKIRLGWGVVGNDRIANYLSLDLYTDSKYGVGNKLVTVMNPKQLANKNLKWEGSSTANIGFDLGFFNGRMNLTVDYFVKNTKDLLLAQDLAHVTGFNSQWQNIGKIQNKGFEINLNTVNMQKRHFLWQSDFNISFIENKLKSLQSGANSMYAATRFNSNFSGYDYIASVGSSIGQIYGYVFDGVYQSSDFNITPDGRSVLKPGVTDISTHSGRPVEPGMVKYKDINGDGVITTEDRTVIGNGLPKFYGGLTNTFMYRSFDLSVLLQFTYGNDVYNATRMFHTQTQSERANQFAEVVDRWTPTNASNVVPSANGYVRYELYSRFVEDGSFLRLKHITLGYTLPKKLLNRKYINNARFYGTAQNLLTWTRYKGSDPEVNMKSSPLMPGFDWGAYPMSRVLTAGVEVHF